MNDNNQRPGKKLLIQTVALLFALAINGAIAMAMLHSGVDSRPGAPQIVARLAPAPLVANLGELPMITVHGCRTAS